LAAGGCWLCLTLAGASGAAGGFGDADFLGGNSFGGKADALGKWVFWGTWEPGRNSVFLGGRRGLLRSLAVGVAARGGGSRRPRWDGRRDFLGMERWAPGNWSGARALGSDTRVFGIGSLF